MPGHVYRRTAGAGYPELLQVRVPFSSVMTALGEPVQMCLIKCVTEHQTRERERAQSQKVKQDEDEVLFISYGKCEG